MDKCVGEATKLAATLVSIPVEGQNTEDFNNLAYILIDSLVAVTIDMGELTSAVISACTTSIRSSN